MVYTFGARLDDDSYALTTINEDQGTASTKGEINGVPFEGGGGSSDFDTVTVTVTNNADAKIKLWNFPVLTEADKIYCEATLSPSDSYDFEAVTYKGAARCYVCDDSYNLIPSAYVTVTGDIEKITDIEDEDWHCLITGDGTISVP